MINTKDLVWQKISELKPPTNILQWLKDDNSLTQKLKNSYPNFNLELLSQVNTVPLQNEIDVLKINDISLIREIFLKNKETPLIFARSIIPKTPDTIDLYTLNKRPLGEVLFQDKSIKRYGLEVTQTNGIWGRRNIFQIKNTPILVSEFFLKSLF